MSAAQHYQLLMWAAQHKNRQNFVWIRTVTEIIYWLTYIVNRQKKKFLTYN